MTRLAGDSLGLVFSVSSVSLWLVFCVRITPLGGGTSGAPTDCGGVSFEPARPSGSVTGGLAGDVVGEAARYRESRLLACRGCVADPTPSLTMARLALPAPFTA